MDDDANPYAAPQTGPAPDDAPRRGRFEAFAASLWLVLTIQHMNQMADATDDALAYFHLAIAVGAYWLSAYWFDRAVELAAKAAAAEKRNP